MAANESERTERPMAEERKVVTVMFADLAGFTTLSEQLDPEHVRRLVNAWFDCMVPVIEKYGGTVDKFIGDEIMGLFGAPVAHENDPERGLQWLAAAMECLAVGKGAVIAISGEPGLGKSRLVAESRQS